MPLLDIGSASYFAIAFLAYLIVNVYLLRHAHHLNDLPFMGIKWWPIGVFLSFKLALAIFYTILIKAKSHPFVFLTICGSINLISVFNFEGVIVFLSLE
ncbi:MAG: hypothetical protein OQJ95_04760 [Kangiella sp.]|jgi:hypothetical protein|nr:hypothetical protein [Kangiella sp.]MCW9029310.1 hypothetical protein [Kangiella sp.]